MCYYKEVSVYVNEWEICGDIMDSNLWDYVQRTGGYSGYV